MKQVFFPFVEECRKEFSDWKPGMLIQNYPWKKRIIEELTKLANEDTINLSSNKRRALFDFVTVLPEIGTKIITRDNIIYGAKKMVWLMII